MYDVTNDGVLKTIESWLLIVPLHDNDGHRFAKNEIDDLIAEILLDYPGFSLSSGTGYWKGSEKTFVDENYQILIDTVPDSVNDSSKFFARLKEKLQQSLRQEKIYITKQTSKQEFLSFEEFFEDAGLQIEVGDSKEEVQNLVTQLVASWEFVSQRMGYETTVLKRDPTTKNIVWERKLCGVKLKSEITDIFPPGIKLLATDQLLDIGDALLKDEPFVIIGNHESVSYILATTGYRPVVEADTSFGHTITTQYLSQKGEPLELERFIEDFTGSVLAHWILLREEGHLAKDIILTVGSDGSLQHTNYEKNNALLYSPALIPDEAVQKEILRCLKEAIHLYEANRADPISILQIKAKNNFVLNRAFVRRISQH